MVDIGRGGGRTAPVNVVSQVSGSAIFITQLTLRYISDGFNNRFTHRPKRANEYNYQRLR